MQIIICVLKLIYIANWVETIRDFRELEEQYLNITDLICQLH